MRTPSRDLETIGQGVWHGQETGHNSADPIAPARD
jgi:hypothetical protein